jgi:positive regulator of sigma E activity
MLPTSSFLMVLFVRMIIIAVNMTLHNNIFHSNSYIILICVMCLWPGLVVDTRYKFLSYDMINSAQQSLIRRARACIANGGGHFFV